MTTTQLYDAIDRSRARKSENHRYGICGGTAGLCSDCFDAERALMIEFAATLPEPRPNDDYCTYWRREGQGVYLDAWPEASASRVYAKKHA